MLDYDSSTGIPGQSRGGFVSASEPAVMPASMLKGQADKNRYASLQREAALLSPADGPRPKETWADRMARESTDRLYTDFTQDIAEIDSDLMNSLRVSPERLMERHPHLRAMTPDQLSLAMAQIHEEAQMDAERRKNWALKAYMARSGKSLPGEAFKETP